MRGRQPPQLHRINTCPQEGRVTCRLHKTGWPRLPNRPHRLRLLPHLVSTAPLPPISPRPSPAVPRIGSQTRSPAITMGLCTLGRNPRRGQLVRVPTVTDRNFGVTAACLARAASRRVSQSDARTSRVCEARHASARRSGLRRLKLKVLRWRRCPNVALGPWYLFPQLRQLLRSPTARGW